MASCRKNNFFVCFYVLSVYADAPCAYRTDNYSAILCTNYVACKNTVISVAAEVGFISLFIGKGFRRYDCMRTVNRSRLRLLSALNKLRKRLRNGNGGFYIAGMNTVGRRKDVVKRGIKILGVI